MTPNWVVLFEAIRAAWDADTSAIPQQWSAANPALGQCAVTALVVQDHLGGVLLRGTVNGQSHYWNRFADGTMLDLTITQFPSGSPRLDVQVRERDYVLSFPATAARYATLKARVDEALA